MPGCAGVRAGGRGRRAGLLRVGGAGWERRCRGGRVGRSLLARSILLDPFAACVSHPGGAGAADPGAASVMLVSGGHVADAGVQADRVVLGTDAVQFGIERGGVGDRDRVRPVAPEVREEALDGKRRTTGMKMGMKESYVEDLAKSRRPRVMRWRPVRALTRSSTRQPSHLASTSQTEHQLRKNARACRT